MERFDTIQGVQWTCNIFSSMKDFSKGSKIYYYYYIIITDLQIFIGFEYCAILYYVEWYNADDTQVYLSVPASDAPLAVNRLTDCIDKIEHWMGCNRLRLNVDKTQVIWMGTRQQLEKIGIDELIYCILRRFNSQRRWSIWASSSTISWKCPNKCPCCVVLVSSSCVKFGQSGGPWRQIQQRHSWMPSLTVA